MLLEILRNSFLTRITDLQSVGSDVTTIELLTKVFENIWKILGNFQQSPGLQTQPSIVLKFQKILKTSAMEFRFTETLHLLLKLYLPLVHRIDFAHKFQLNHKNK